MKYCTALQITLLYIIHQYTHLNQQGAHFWYKTHLPDFKDHFAFSQYSKQESYFLIAFRYKKPMGSNSYSQGMPFQSFKWTFILTAHCVREQRLPIQLENTHLHATNKDTGKAHALCSFFPQ